MKKFGLLIPLILSAVACVPAVETPAPTPETCDNCQGYVLTDVVSNDQITSGIMLSNNKFLTFGRSNHFYTVVRYNSDGTLDNTFDSDGVVQTNLGASPTTASLLEQSDGKIVASGNKANSGNNSLILVRYNIDGSLDDTFDSDGIVETDVGGNLEYAGPVIQQSDNKLVLTGYYDDTANDYEQILVRYNENGSIDTGFGTDGIVITPIGDQDFSFAAIIQHDNKIVVAGSSYQSGDKLTLVRYNIDGSLDNTFATNGIYTSNLSGSSRAYGLVQLPDNKLLVTGHHNNNVLLAKFNANGTLDADFDSDGIVETNLGGSSHARKVVIQIDGKYVATGFAYNGVDNDIVTLRYLADGNLDTTFVGDAGLGNGIVYFDSGNGHDNGINLELQVDGKLVAFGQARNLSDNDHAIVRMNSDGTLDTENFGPSP